MGLNISAGLVLWILGILIAIASVASFSRPKRQPVLGVNKTLMGFILGIIAVGIIAGQLGYLTNIGYAPLAVTGAAVSPQVSTSGSGTFINTVNPAISFSTADKQQTGTSVGIATAQVSTGGAPYATITAGTTTAVPGQSLDILLSNTSTYHAAYYGADVAGDQNVQQSTTGSLQVTSTSFPLQVTFNKNATVTEQIYSTTGIVLDNNASVFATVNQTDLGNGASYSMKDAMSGLSLASTQDMACIVEITAGVNASSSPAGAQLSLNGNAIPLVSTSKPNWNDTAGVNSVVYRYDIAPLNSGAEVDYQLLLTAKATGRFPAASRVLKTCYTKEYFIDPISGKVVYDIQDSLGNLKSSAQYKFFFF